MPPDLRFASHKHLLRDTAARAGVPQFILDRAKSGFGVQRIDWAARGGVLEALVPVAGKVVGERELRDLQSVEPQRAMTFWTLLTYGIWRRLVIDGETAGALVSEIPLTT